MHRSINTLLISALSLFALQTMAQGEDTERWFKVELMIFSHETGHNSSEQWEATPELAYPGASRFLVKPDQVKANLTQYENLADSVVDEFGRQTLTLLPTVELEAEEAPYGFDPGTGGRQPEEIEALQLPVEPNEPVVDELPQLPLKPTPFIALPSSERTFHGKAAYMQRSGRYRTLFHQAWYQPVASETQALPLVIDRSGDTGEWSRLQGSVKIHLSRYLHIETNLWLNTDGHYLPGEWRMPAPPLGPPSLIIEELPPPEWALDAEQPETPDEEEAWDEWPENSALDPNAVPEEVGPQYPYRHAVLLQQKRRMRSIEVHYIDHPLMGVVITFTPVTEEELEVLALESVSLDEGSAGP